RVGLEDLDAVVGRARERMVRRDPALRLLVPLRGRHVDHPQELPERLVDEAELAAELQAQQAEHLGDETLVAGAEEQRVSRLAPALEQLGREELRDRRRELAVGAEDDVREALGAPRL